MTLTAPCGMCSQCLNGIPSECFAHAECRYCGSDPTGHDRLGRICCDECREESDDFADLWETVPTESTGDPLGERQAFSWLIERGQAVGHSPVLWWVAGPNLDRRDGERWTDVATEATRFESSAEGQVVVDRLFRVAPRYGGGHSALAVEHGFVGSL